MACLQQKAFASAEVMCVGVAGHAEAAAQEMFVQGAQGGAHTHLSSSPQFFYISLTGFKLLLQLHQSAVLNMHLRP